MKSSGNALLSSNYLLVRPSSLNRTSPLISIFLYSNDYYYYYYHHYHYHYHNHYQYDYHGFVYSFSVDNIKKFQRYACICVQICVQQFLHPAVWVPLSITIFCYFFFLFLAHGECLICLLCGWQQSLTPIPFRANRHRIPYTQSLLQHSFSCCFFPFVYKHNSQFFPLNTCILQYFLFSFSRFVHLFVFFLFCVYVSLHHFIVNEVFVHAHAI